MCGTAQAAAAAGAVTGVGWKLGRIWLLLLPLLQGVVLTSFPDGCNSGGVLLLLLPKMSLADNMALLLLLMQALG